jgi:hypothetical protein
MTKEIIIIQVKTKNGKIKNKQQEAKRVSSTDNFYVFEEINDNYKAFSLTVMPLGVAIMHFKYKKDAEYMAKKLYDSDIDFNREYIKLVEDEKLKKLIFDIREEINAGSNSIRAGMLQSFPMG